MSDSLDVLLAKRFIERRDVKAEQHRDGSWSPVVVMNGRERTDEYLPWKMTDIRAHLEGTHTYGHYLVAPETNHVKLFAFDIDLTKTGLWVTFKEDKLMEGGSPCNPREMWLTGTDEERKRLTVELRCMAEALAAKAHRITDGEFPIAIAYSGSKGLHVYGFTGSVPAQEARAIAVETLKSFNCFKPVRGENFWAHEWLYRNMEIEVFPKQDNLDNKDFGNLMRLPCGINLKSGQHGFFMDPRCEMNELKELDPLVALGEGVGEMLN